MRITFAAAIATGFLVILTHLQPSGAIAHPHPLPPTLAQWQDPTNSGDYFSQVQATEIGYLVWSQFPIKVYVQRPEPDPNGWAKSVLQAVREWNVYLPLQVVEKPEIADIRIWRTRAPLRRNITRAPSAETRYELYSRNAVLAHRCTIWLSPNQTGKYIPAAARHELGHALGIWGHSQLPTDALYFSQVSNPPPISPRDINTLKRVYQQPTSLGWRVGE